MRSSYVLFIAAILAFAGSSCKRKGGVNIDQGEIHYTIEYVGTFAFPTEALPRNLVIKFEKDKILFEMVGLGNSGIINLSNPDLGILDTYYNFFGVHKFYYPSDEGEMFPGFESMKGMKLRKTSKTAVICGYNCEHAEVTLPAKPDKVYNIWYTDEIRVQNPNAATPFNEIKGVLMNFFFILGSTEFHFNAETVYSKDLPEGTFMRKKSYKRISRQDIIEHMNGMLEFVPDEHNKKLQ